MLRSMAKYCPTARRLFHTVFLQTPVPTGSKERSFKYVFVPFLYIRAWSMGLWTRRSYQNVERFCIFIGYPRSGHSIVGAMLDAHHAAMISHEVDVLDLVRRGFASRLQIFYLIKKNSERFGQTGRGWSGYSYAIPGQSQGQTTSPRVIGDKEGSSTVAKLQTDGKLLEKTEYLVKLPVNLIHHIRNPYDVIASVCRDEGEKEATPIRINWFFEHCETIQNIRQNTNTPVFDGKHEELIADPRAYMGRLCAFLGLESNSDYLTACANIVENRLRKTRNDVRWSPEQIAEVAKKMKAYDFLDAYAFKESTETDDRTIIGPRER